MPKKKIQNVRGSQSANRFGHAPKVHYAKNSFPGDTDSLCGRCYYGTPTDDPVDCFFCIRIAEGVGKRP